MARSTAGAALETVTRVAVGCKREPTASEGIAWTRRDVIHALGLGGLAWCVSSALRAAAPPWPACLGSGPAPHRRIDAHVHIFNGTDLQIAGFLKTSIANEYPQVKPVLEILADSLQAFVWANSPTAQKELERLNKLADEGKAGAFSEAVFGSALAADRAETEAQYDEFLRQRLQDDELRKTLQQMIPPDRPESTPIKTLLGSPPKDAASARELARQVDAASGIPLFDYLKPYFSYRYVNFFELAQQFTCEKNSNIDTFVALLVDFDQPLGKPGRDPPSSIDRQTAVISRICELSRGRLLALVPYCPFKDVARKGESLKNVSQAWKRPGFVGAKVYPPMGFYPYDVGNDPAVNGALEGFFRQCVAADAPIMAHAGSSLCVSGRPCEYPGPPGWEAALEFGFKIKQEPLRVALGHFGGPFGRVASAKDWPERFVRLMESPSGQHLYADLGYASEVLKKSNDKRIVGRLKSLLTSSSSPLSDRLMYGTDWLMLGLERNWQKYATRMGEVIAKTETATGLQGFGTKFFGSNARNWLGIDRPTSLAARNSAGL